MEGHETADIVAVRPTIWKGKTQLKVHGIYSPLNNKNFNLVVITSNNNTFIAGDFNAASDPTGDIPTKIRSD